MAALALALVHAWPAAARGAGDGPIALDTGWEIRWGDLPPGSAPAPSDLPGAGASAPGRLPVVASGAPTRRTVWLRRTLPERRFRDPVLLARAVDQTLEIWVDGRPIYRLGDLDGRREVFATADWSHLANLPEDFGGKELTIRIRSSYSRAGVGEIRIGPREALVRELVANDVERVVVGLLALFSGALEALIFLRRPGERLHLAFGGFGLAIGTFLVSQSAPAQLLVDAPTLWTHVAFASLYLTPVGALAFVEELFGPGPASLLRRARQACGAYAVAALALAGMGLVSLTRTLPPFLVLLAASSILTVAITLRAALRGSRDGRILLLGMSCLLVAAANDILVSLGVLTWLVRLVEEATFVVLISLGGIAANQLAEIHSRLRTYSHALERKNAELTRLTDGLEHVVEARTRELQAARDELELRNRDLAATNTALAHRAASDSLTGLLNHGAFIARLDEILAGRRASDFPVSVVMLDLDHFKRINDTFGHPLGDEVLRRVASALRDVVREGDHAARYGGEEFALLLPGCTVGAAHVAAERLRGAIAAIRVPGAPELRVTASLGVAAAADPHEGLDGRQTIGRADEALYEAKTAGRDRVCWSPRERAVS
jgi:diguanylate cyclase (GGDEF)-like protein